MHIKAINDFDTFPGGEDSGYLGQKDFDPLSWWLGVWGEELEETCYAS